MTAKTCQKLCQVLLGDNNLTVLKAADRNRTDNLMITNQVLCQLSYGGEGKRSGEF